SVRGIPSRSNARTPWCWTSTKVAGVRRPKGRADTTSARSRLIYERGTEMSIATTKGDAGETSLAGGVRVSKASLRVETYGTIDELNSSLGFARSICDDPEIAAFTRNVQQDLFRVGSSLATPAESSKAQIEIAAALVERLTAEVHRLETVEGILADWSLPGEHRAAAA